MKPDFRKCMIWLHTYMGLILGWLLFVIFVTGTLSYFTPEITRWMSPEKHPISLTQRDMLNHSLAYLNKNAQDASEWRVYFPTTRNQEWYIRWSENGQRTRVDFDNNKNAITDKTETKGGTFFRTFHYTLHMRSYGGRYIAGIAAMGMLIAVFTGIFTHRRIFKDFFTLRKDKLTKWITDFHAVIGLVTLPYYLMIGISAIMIYAIMYMPWSANFHFENGERALNRIIAPRITQLEANSPETNLPMVIDEIAVKASALWTGERPLTRLTIEYPHKENSRVIIERNKTQTVSSQAERLVFSTYTGKPLQGYPEASTPASFRRVLYGIHQAHFASLGLRWLLVFIAILGCALIVTGQIIWVNAQIKKKHKNTANNSTSIGLNIVQKGNVAVFAGLILACFSYFLANRLLPFDLTDRDEAEVTVFFITWFISAMHAILRPYNRAWLEQSAVGAFMAWSIIVIEFAETERLVRAWHLNDTLYLGFMCSFLSCAIAITLLAFWTKKRNLMVHASRKIHNEKPIC